MAGFGFIKPQQISVRAGDVPRFGDLSMQEKLLMLGATLRGDTQSAMQIPLLAAARGRQAAEQQWRSGLNLEGVPMQRQAAIKNDEGEDISAGFAPQMDTVRGPRPTLRDLIPQLKKGIDAGYNVTPYMDLLKATDPEVDYVNGFRVDKRDPNGPSFIPTLEKGQSPDGRGGVGNLPGYVQSVADLERAKTEATERTKAQYDFVEIPMSDGSVVKLPRLQASERFSGGGSGGGTGGDATPGSLGAGFGRSQTPAEREVATGRAKTQVEVEALTPKARAAIDTLDRKTTFVLDALRKAAGQSTGGLGGAAGLNAIAAGVPETAAYDLRSTLDTIEAAVGFDELQQMRDNSPTGGAVGNLTERELSLLASLRGSLKQGQSPEQLRANIERMTTEISKVRNERRQAFERQYGGERTTQERAAASGSTRSAPPANREVGKVYQTPRGPMKWTGTGWLPQ